MTEHPASLATSSIVLDLSLVDRETALRSWLAYHGVQKSALAKAMGVSPSTITRVIQGQRNSRDLISRLVEFGIPAGLLPTPKG